MPKFFKPTVAFSLAMGIAIFAYDLWAVIQSYDDTISWTITTAAHKFLTIPFFFGYIAGHLFGAGKADEAPPAGGA